ncbi:MAG: hypothetical protein K5886_04565 [Lachnospiraceae bacterium]|nr:hypothetical protein [Lachnospiraceae bacterium]
MDIRIRRRLKRQLARHLRMLLLLPARLPKLTVSTFDLIQKVCEFSGIILVVTLLAAMISRNSMVKLASVLSFIVFFVSFSLIRIRVYQDDLTAHGYMR